MTILLNANQQTCVLLSSVAIVILLLTPHPYGPITFILSKPMKAIKVLNAFNKSHFSTISTFVFRDYSSQHTQAVPRLHLPTETNVRTSVPLIEPIPPKPAHLLSRVSTERLTRTDFDARDKLNSAPGTSTQIQVRSDKPRALSSRLLRIIPTIALWIGFTLVVIALLVTGILSVVYGGLPIRPQ